MRSFANRVAAGWLLHRRGLVVASAVLGLLSLTVAVAALAVRASGSRKADPVRASTRATVSTEVARSSPAAAPSDVLQWNAMSPVEAGTSGAYPAVAPGDRRDPTSYARAFAIELFTRDYRHQRDGQLSWAQYEDSPLESPHYPAQDWSKVLVDSLTDLGWDGAADTPVPAEGTWLALRSERAVDTVGDVHISLDPQWEQAIADGRQSPDPLATVRDVTLTILRHSTAAKRATVTRFDVSIAIQLGTSPHGGYGVAATNNYVIKEVG